MAKNLNVSLGLNPQGFTQGLKDATRSLQRFASKTQSIGRTITQSITLPLGGVAAGAIAAFSELDGLQKGLNAVAGSAEEGTRQFERLREAAKLPGLALPQAVKGSIQLQAVGFSAQAAERALIGLSKATTLTGGGPEVLNSVVRQLTQITGKGKILQEDLAVILENAPALNQVLVDAFGGVSAEQINKSVKNTDEFVERLLSTIEASETLQNVQGGLANAINNFGQSVKFSLAQIGLTINETFNLTNVLDRLSEFINRAVERFRNLDPQVRKTIIVIAGLAAAIGPAILAVSGIASGLAVFLNPIGLTITAIAALTAGFIALYNNNEVFRKGVNDLGKFLKAAFIVVLRNVRGVLSEINAFLGLIRAVAIQLRENLSQLGITGQGAFLVIRNEIGRLADAALFVFNVFSGVAIGLRKVFLEILTIARESIQGFVDAWQSVKERDFSGAFKAIGGALTKLNPVTAATVSGNRLVGSFYDGFKSGFDNNPIVNFYNQIKAELAKQNKGIEQAAQDTGNKLRNDLSGAVVDTGAALRGGTGVEKEAVKTTTPENNQALINGILSRIEFTRTLTQDTEKLATALSRQAINEEQVAAGFAQIAANQEKAAKATATGTFLLNKFGGAFDAVFENISKGAKSAFDAFAQAIKQILIELAKALIKAAAFAAITSLISGGTLNFAGAFKGIFGQLAGFKFADGGIVTKPTRGLVGEAGPEAIIPLDRIFSGSGQKQELELRVEGTELVALLRNSESVYNRMF